LQKGREALGRARTANAKTQRERDYIAALDTFYKDAGKLGSVYISQRNQTSALTKLKNPI
jgi:hypothetical protein